MMHRIMLTEALTIYVVAISLEYDLDEHLTSKFTDDDLPYDMTHRQNLLFWLNSIYCRAPKAPILVVCTKADLIDKDVRKRRLGVVQQCIESSVALNNIVGYRMVSSKTGEGIDEVRSILKKKRTSLMRYGSEVPLGWFKFSSIIRELAMQEPCITLSEARSIALDCGVTTHEEFTALLQEMNDLGFVIWHNTERAQDLVVLHVNWMVQQMTKLLCKRSLGRIPMDDCLCDWSLIKQLRDEGRLKAAAIPAVWPELQTDEERESLLAYMVRFGLCSKLPTSEDEWLVPALLPTVEDSSAIWKSNNICSTTKLFVSGSCLRTPICHRRTCREISFQTSSSTTFSHNQCACLVSSLRNYT